MYSCAKIGQVDQPNVFQPAPPHPGYLKTGWRGMGRTYNHKFCYTLFQVASIKCCQLPIHQYQGVMMITVVAQFEVKPAELDQFLQHCDELIAETRKENGCLSYHLYQNTQQPNQVSFIELWQNQAVLDTHSASAHFTRIVPVLVEACEKAPVIQLYTQIK